MICGLRRENPARCAQPALPAAGKRASHAVEDQARRRERQRTAARAASGAAISGVLTGSGTSRVLAKTTCGDGSVALKPSGPPVN